MSIPISLPSIQPPALAAVAPISAVEQGSAATEAFQSVLSDAMENVGKTRQEANATVNRFLSGEGEEIHNVALAIHKSEASFQMFTQVRNKVISAYQEVMRLQL